MMRRRSRPKTKHLPKGLVIIHEDKDILVVDKPPGLLTVGTDTEKSRTAYFALTQLPRSVEQTAVFTRTCIFLSHYIMSRAKS